MVGALAQGWSLAVQFNPLTALIGAIIAAVALSRGVDAVRVAIAVIVLGAAWYLGDGAGIVAYVLGDGTGGAGEAAFWVAAIVWGAGGITLGYVIPALAGGFVGRNVTFGTGWASAAIVAAMVSGLAGMLSGRFV